MHELNKIHQKQNSRWQIKGVGLSHITRFLSKRIKASPNIISEFEECANTNFQGCEKILFHLNLHKTSRKRFVIRYMENWQSLKLTEPYLCGCREWNQQNQLPNLLFFRYVCSQNLSYYVGWRLEFIIQHFSVVLAGGRLSWI